MKKIVIAAALVSGAVFANSATRLDMPFSTYGSHLAVSTHTEDDWGEPHKAGIWLRTVYRCAANRYIARIVPMLDGCEIAATGLAESPELLAVHTSAGDIEVTFADPSTVLLRSKSPTLSVRLDMWRDTRWNLAWEVPSSAGRTVTLATLFASGVKLVADVRRGTKTLKSDWNGFDTKSCEIDVAPSADGFEIALRDCVTDWDGKLPTVTFDDAVANQRASFGKFLAAVPSVPAEFAETRVRAARLMWSSVVGAGGNFKRPGMLMSKNWMNRVWSWDHAFNAMALAYGNMDAAWDQYMCVFDAQAENGQLPDAMDAHGTVWGFVKPPIHGWALRRMMKSGTVSDARAKEAYDRLSRWTQYWTGCRDRDHNGLVEYDHGNDSGWDNSTIFMNTLPIETPELQAYLALQMETLADLADRLGKKSEAKQWRERSASLIAKTVDTLFDAEGRPLARRIADGRTATSDTLLLRLQMILGDRLPEGIRRRLVEEVGSAKFLTEYGLATESPSSEHYTPDGYWRGPIWAPETMIAIDGLRACGAGDLARDLALKFCRLCKDKGFAENFDALTGEPLRDKAYTWTASVFLILAHELAAPAAGGQAPTNAPVRVVACVGDSITYGHGASKHDATTYPARLQALLGDGWKVVNFGHNARTALNDGREWNGQGKLGYRDSPQFAKSLAARPDFVIFMLGTNDSKPKNWDGREADFKRDYAALVDDYLALSPKPVVIIGVSPFVKKDSFTIRESVVGGAIAPWQRQFAAERGLPVVDAYEVMKTHARDGYIGDGVHPGDAGYTALAEAFAAKLRELSEP